MHKDKAAADLESAIQRLQDLRFEVGEQVVWLAARAGRQHQPAVVVHWQDAATA